MAGTEGAALATARPLRLGTLRTTQPSPTPASPSRAPRVSFRRRRRRNGHPARWTRDSYQQGGGSDRDTHFNPDSSPKLPADLGAGADRAAQAVFEEAVADGSYCADPDFEWEPGDECS